MQAYEVIYHWNAREHRFVGRSIAEEAAVEDTAAGRYSVALRNFTPIAADINLDEVRARADALYSLRDELQAKYGKPLYLPFQFKKDRSKLAFMSNYFAKLPAAMVPLLFDDDGLAEKQLPELPPLPGDTHDEGTSPWVDPGHHRRGFLSPFKKKADSDYVRNVRGGRRTVPRLHERLVNECADWLIDNGFSPARNAAVDLGLDEPPVVFEAKVVGKSWPSSIREAVGQLYEYRFFKVAEPQSKLVFLADRGVPQLWVNYLEKDRGIGSMWPLGDGTYHLSRLTRRALGL